MIPIILFTYARPDHLQRTLDCLRDNKVPLIYAFSDGPCAHIKAPAVDQVRDILRAIDWCDVILRERETNLGLGRSVLTGVTEVLDKHKSAIVFEDDLICQAGTYKYLCAALEHYQNDSRVMSVTGWTHPLILPRNVTNSPYFDGRGESLSWGTWARSWKDMKEDAMTLMKKCESEGIDIYKYGADLPDMAKVELKSNIWAVRFCYWHIMSRGLCLRPPWSMVEHIGFDDKATNAKNAGPWANYLLRPCPPIPKQWPEPVEHPECSFLWQQATGTRPTVFQRFYRFARYVVGGIIRLFLQKT